MSFLNQLKTQANALQKERREQQLNLEEIAARTDELGKFNRFG